MEEPEEQSKDSPVLKKAVSNNNTSVRVNNPLTEPEKNLLKTMKKDLYSCITTLQMENMK